jgi:FMN phosphatase YigB (HAD superfamily)
MADPAMVAFNSGQIGPEEFFERMRKTCRLQIDYDAFCRLWCGIFYPMEGMEELVTGLDRRVTVGLLSDTDPLHWNFIIRRWPWIGTLQRPTLSYQIGVMKPSPAIYLAAARRVKTPPQNCLYIDDLEDNVQGARVVGMTAVRFENVPQLKMILNELKLL